MYVHVEILNMTVNTLCDFYFDVYLAYFVGTVISFKIQNVWLSSRTCFLIAFFLFDDFPQRLETQILLSNPLCPSAP